MSKNKLIKRIVSFLVLMTIFATMMPNFVFASSSDNLAGISNWNIIQTPEYAEFISSGDGVRISQTNTIDDTGNFDGEYDLYFTKTNGKGYSVSTEAYRGNVTVTVKYSIELDSELSSGAFYQLIIPGYTNFRIYQDKISVRSSAGNKTLNTNNTAGNENTLVINIDTVNDLVDVILNSESALDVPATITGTGYVSKINLKAMDRMNIGAYLDISSVTIEDDDSVEITLDAETQAIIDSLPDTLAEDQNNVTENVTVPWENTNVRWTSSNPAIMDNYGKIQRMSEDDPTEVTLSAVIDGKTADGTAKEITITYKLNVTGLNDRLNNTATVGATSDTEKWYTPPVRNGNEDGYEILGDPNYISDEAFFGKWDSTNSKWILKPFFDYDSYDGLSAVKAYAKAGDYENAKAAIKTYYADNFANKATKQESLAEEDIIYTDLLYEMVSRNAYPTNVTSGHPINSFYVTNTKSAVEIDVTRRLKEAVGSFSCFSTMVVSVDKYKSDSVIYSKESGTAPVLVVTLKDGSTVECPAIKDSYIQGGTYSGTNYGDASELLVQEAGVHNNFEDRTKRAYIGFDISELPSSSKITEAHVELTCKNNGSDSSRMLLLYWYKDSSWQEDTVCFNTFSDYLYFSCNDMVCWDYVTSNLPSIKGKACGYHRGYELGDINDLYSYYDYTGNADKEKYAYTLIRQYMGLINSVGIDHNIMNNLDLACHMSAVSQDFLRLINSEYMTPEIFTAFLKHLWLLAEDHIYEGFGKKDNNWATYSTAGVYSICARYPEFARHDTWLTATKNENERVTGNFVFADGMSYELSQSYTGTLLTTFDQPYTVHEETGAELPYNQTNEEIEEIILNLVRSLCNQTAPGFGGFGFGDSPDPYDTKTAEIKKWYNRLLVSRGLTDPALEYMSTRGQSGWMPEHATTNYPVGLRTFMRSDWTSDALAMGFTNNLSGSHGHKDALSISMYAYGKFLLVDPGYGAALTGNITDYMLSPQQHNVVTINDYENYLNDDNTVADGVKNTSDTLKDIDGTQECFDSNSHYDFIEYSTTAYTNAELSQRSVTFLKNQKMWIVTDYIVPKDTSATNVYTQNWHLSSDSQMTIDSDKIIRSNTENSPNVMIIPVAPDEIDEAYSARTLFSGEAGNFEESQKAVLKKTATGSTTYSTIIIPMDEGEDFTVTR
ncbi:MAG: heparinase II/III family protein, partial [Clostridia bacterium]|nr:heparinase II/III family protein [Clostridia bacterium]